MEYQHLSSGKERKRE